MSHDEQQHQWEEGQCRDEDDEFGRGIRYAKPSSFKRVTAIKVKRHLRGLSS